VLSLASAPAGASEPASCQSDQQCPPWALCSVSTGTCHTLGMEQVCSGFCEAGTRWRLVPRAGAVLSRESEPDHGRLALALGLEVVPPLLDGAAAIAADWWSIGHVRAGFAASWPLLPPLRLGFGAYLTRSSETWGASPVITLDYFPWWPFRSLTMAHYFSLGLEGGLLWPGRHPFLITSLRLWPPTWR
jgi:hypothetical protein